jgi:hypothetical protein
MPANSPLWAKFTMVDFENGFWDGVENVSGVLTVID